MSVLCRLRLLIPNTSTVALTPTCLMVCSKVRTRRSDRSTAHSRHRHLGRSIHPSGHSRHRLRVLALFSLLTLALSTAVALAGGLVDYDKRVGLDLVLVARQNFFESLLVLEGHEGDTLVRIVILVHRIFQRYEDVGQFPKLLEVCLQIFFRQRLRNARHKYPILFLHTTHL